MQKDLRRFLNYLTAERNASPYTISNYRREIAQFLMFLEADGISEWSDVTRTVLRRYLGWLNSQGYAKASIARRLSELRSFGRFLMRERIVPQNPFRAVSSPKLPKRLPSAISQPDARTLVTAPDLTTPQGLRDRAMLEVLYATGLRVSELINLQQSQVMLEDIGSKEFLPELERLWGEFYLKTHDADQAIEHTRQAITLAQTYSDPLEEAIAHRLLGQIHMASGSPQLAEEALNASLSMLDHLNNEHEIARTKLALARLGLIEKTMPRNEMQAHLKEAIETFEKLGARVDLAQAVALQQKTE